MSRRSEEGRPGERGLHGLPRGCELSGPGGWVRARPEEACREAEEPRWWRPEQGDKAWGLGGRPQPALGACETHRSSLLAERTVPKLFGIPYFVYVMHHTREENPETVHSIENGMIK